MTKESREREEIMKEEWKEDDKKGGKNNEWMNESR